MKEKQIFDDNIFRIKQKSPSIVPTSPSIQTRRGKKTLPIPKGNGFYAQAKKAEYEMKDLSMAEALYKQALYVQDNTESAVKDLAGVMHQQGKTKEACDFLQSQKHLFFADLPKYENLLTNLRKQINPTGNFHKKNLKISGISPRTTQSMITDMFKNPSRIQEVALNLDEECAVLKFASHSAARKTLEGFDRYEEFSLTWNSVDGADMGPVDSPASAVTAPSTPIWDFIFFSPDVSNDSAFPPLSLVKTISAMSEDLDLDEVRGKIGSGLFDCIFNEDELNPAANEYVPSTI